MFLNNQTTVEGETTMIEMLYGVVFVLLVVAPFGAFLDGVRLTKGEILPMLGGFFVCWGLAFGSTFIVEMSSGNGYVVSFDNNGKVTNVGKILWCYDHCATVPSKVDLEGLKLLQGKISFSGTLTVTDEKKMAEIISLRPQAGQDDEKLPVPRKVFYTHLETSAWNFLAKSADSIFVADAHASCLKEMNKPSCLFYLDNVLDEFEKQLAQAGLKFTMEGRPVLLLK